MLNVARRLRLRSTPMTWFVILTLITIGLALGLPPDPHAVRQLHTSETAYRIAVAALLIPYVLIWYTSFYAFAKLREYSKPLRGTKDGAAFHKIAVGMGTLAFSLIIPTTISLILNSIAGHHPSFKTTAIIIDNYLSLFPGLISFLLLYNGACALVSTIRSTTKVRKLDLRWHAPWFLLLSIVFSHLTIQNQYHRNPYHLAEWLLIATFIVPYLYGWMVGLLSAHMFRAYSRTVPGLLYRQATGRFAIGVAIVIAGSIAVQFLNIALAQRSSNSLGSVLLLDYGLLIIVTVGLALMALGTKKLQRIEEI